METTCGNLRQQLALVESERKIVLVADDPEIPKLEVVTFYPDTTNEKSEWMPTFKIQVRKAE